MQNGTVIRKVLVVYLKDVFYSNPPGQGGAAQWHYTLPDAAELKVDVLGSGSLLVYKVNAESPVAEDGQRKETVAFFPVGGYAGYCWEPVPVELSAAMAGLAVAR